MSGIKVRGGPTSLQALLHRAQIALRLVFAACMHCDRTSGWRGVRIVFGAALNHTRAEPGKCNLFP
jgi:hypothetical protein